MIRIVTTFITLSAIMILGGCGDTSSTSTKKNAISKEKYGIIARIPEASGICYSQTRNSIFVVSDKGIVVELNRNGAVLRDQSFSGRKHHDFEGVACNDAENTLAIAIEGVDNVLILNQETFNVERDLNIKRGNILGKDKENGLEGIAIVKGELFLSNQSYEPYPESSDPSVVFTLDSQNDAEPNIKTIYDHGYRDIAGLSFYKDYLYMVSDNENLLIKYDIQKEETVFTKQLPKFTVEGITFDNKNNIYFADDSGGIIYKYKNEKYGI